MTERPILFSGAMVRALLDGSKTQTRRLLKVPCQELIVRDDGSLWPWSEHPDKAGDYWHPCPYGEPGDRLYVRETWASMYDAQSPRSCWYRADGEYPQVKKWTPSIHMPRDISRILLEITGVRVERLNECSEADADAEGCERLEFERDDPDWKICPKCGGTRLHSVLGGNGGVIFDCDCRDCDTYVKRYSNLWESINGAGSWAANPWVWVVEFKRVMP